MIWLIVGAGVLVLLVVAGWFGHRLLRAAVRAEVQHQLQYTVQHTLNNVVQGVETVTFEDLMLDWLQVKQGFVDHVSKLPGLTVDAGARVVRRGQSYRIIVPVRHADGQPGEYVIELSPPSDPDRLFRG